MLQQEEGVADQNIRMTDYFLLEKRMSNERHVDLYGIWGVIFFSAVALALLLVRLYHCGVNYQTARGLFL